MNKLQWNFDQNSYIFIQENAFENVWKIVAIFSWPQCVKHDLEEVQKQLTLWMKLAHL